jgi:hypothetical protein
MTNGKKGAAHASKAFSPSDEHQLTIAQATKAVLGDTITAYGKLVKGTNFSSSELGTTHPHGKGEALQLGLVYGIQNRNQCITLPQPQKVYLPMPDGPADGCGWDPSQYVVWKNLPKNWQTVHLESTAKPLGAALLSRALEIEPVSSEDIVEEWANLSSPPRRNDDLKTLWAASGDPLASDFNAGAAKLAELLMPHASPGQTIDQSFILGLSPNTVGQLATQLGF